VTPMDEMSSLQTITHVIKRVGWDVLFTNNESGG